MYNLSLLNFVSWTPGLLRKCNEIAFVSQLLLSFFSYFPDFLHSLFPFPIFFTNLIKGYQQNYRIILFIMNLLSVGAEVAPFTIMMFVSQIITLQHLPDIHKKCADWNGHLMANILLVEEMIICWCYGMPMSTQIVTPIHRCSPSISTRQLLRFLCNFFFTLDTCPDFKIYFKLK